jgi:hypothetical protein
MSAESEVLLPPNTPETFESLCLDVWTELLHDPQADKNGRRGQPQAGVDVFGQENGNWTGVQCKQKESLLWTKLKVAELKEEVAKARKFVPKLSVFILATSGPTDAALQKTARELTDLHRETGDFSVHVWAWPRIWKEIHDRPALLTRLIPRYWPALHAATGKPAVAKDSSAPGGITNQISVGSVGGSFSVKNYLNSRSVEGEE